MNRQLPPASYVTIPVPRVSAWATPRARIEDPVEGAFMAGSALHALDNLVQAESEWSGAWRHRLALRAAAACMKLIGRSEDEAALRDAWLVRQSGDEPGPAGNVLAAWRRLAGRTLPPATDDLEAVAALLGVGRSESFGDLIDVTRDEVRSGAPAPVIAARIAAAAMREDPKAEILAWWLADCALSWRMGWRDAVPILGVQIHAPLLRSGPEGRRARPGSDAFQQAVFIAAALGAAEACRLAADMAAQAERLRTAVPKLRSKAAGDVVERLVADDAVSGTLTTRNLSRWASRRLFDRLVELGAVRELTGRSTFRIYGL
ncbi:hypothetical protein CK222_26885 [Mesorhizobium sp. WSM3866]|uniref:DUF1403 family protein n=1 Tax=Mesorhizobium sp. WSM3866 TaxID=422271 RepID=UPI000BB0C549|nr:DUF1403 family protein [Mesorhizobium sp. WSM3866]PBB40665.1 hypothetical protein CK222_26885 [Mesorhizobium sp. WSM3866]